MRGDKRRWIYAGLAVPPDAALVRRPLRSTASQRVLLTGGPYVHALLAPMTRLATDSATALLVDVRPLATTRDWAVKPWLIEHLVAFRPTIVFLVLDPRDVVARRVIKERIRRAGARDYWLVPPGVPHRGSARFISSPKVNASGVAAWAARAWSVVR